MSDETGEGAKERVAATGAAIGIAARRGLFGGGRGGSGGLGTGFGVGRKKEETGSPTLTVIIVLAVLFGMLGVMFYVNS